MKQLVVILHNIRSIHNVGSIFRTSACLPAGRAGRRQGRDAAGTSKIYLTGTTPAPTDRFGKIRPQFAKVSLGAERYVEWEKVSAISACLRKLKKDNYKIFAVEQSKNSVPYYRTGIFLRKYSGHSDAIRIVRVALVFGNEVSGLPPSILELADKILEIPMRGAMVRQASHPRHAGRGKESLNVSVAFGIVAFGLLCGK